MKTTIKTLAALTVICMFSVIFAATAASSNKVIHVWHTETNPKSRQAIANIVARFEKLHPDIKVEAEALAWGDLEGKIMAALAAGSPPELSHGQPITCAALQAKGLLLPLDEVVEAIGEDNIWEQIKKVGKFGDHYYGLVHAAGTSLLIYRKDLAQKKGLKNPKTWDDLLNIAKELTMDTNGDGKIDIYGMTIPGDNLFINILLGELTKANGGILFDDQNRPRFTDKTMIETLSFLKKLTRYMPPGWEGHGYRETFANMYGQKAAMMYQGYGRGASLIEQYAPPHMANTDYFDVWIHPKAAIEFLKFFYQDENYLEYIQTVPIHFFPITKSLRKSAAYHATPMIKKWKGWLDVQEYYLNNDLVKPTLVIDWKDMHQKPYLMDILGSGILKDMVMEVTKEGVPTEEAAAKAQKKAEELIKDKGYARW
ncbi:MAG: extracellular solute-binding protein [Deltaproteobacteria bacterium]|nr:extracellular solute-binding protein [Deltaproteobacteria bacterium]